MKSYDAVIVGSGPNGMAAAVTMARAGLRVHVIERAESIGGGARSAEITLPGFLHDVCSAVHPMALASRFFRDFELAKRVDFHVPEISYAHPLDGGIAGVAYRDLDRTAEILGRDGPAWRALMRPLVQQIDEVAEFSGSQLLRIPPNPVTAARLGLRVLEQGSLMWGARFRDQVAPSMLAGVNAHAIGRMPSLSTAAVGLVLAAHAHARGWGVPVGGSQAIIDAMAEDLRAHGGSLETSHEVTSLGEVPSAHATLLDVTPRSLLALAGKQLPSSYARALRAFRYGDGVAKVDFALSAPVPWTNKEVRRAPTVHLGGSRVELARGEAQVAAGMVPGSPYVLVSQPTVIDSSRAPSGKHVLWAYCHVPGGSTHDMTEAVIGQIERFAPGFRDIVLASRHVNATEMEAYNPNYVGGDISAGALTLRQLIRRPIFSREPWRTPIVGTYLCSSSTPPGTGVHGMAGLHASRVALKREFGLEVPPLGIDSV